MGKLIIASLFILVGFGAKCQDVNQLTNEENNFIVVIYKSSKCEIFYGNGEGEVVDVDEKAAKLKDIDGSERNLTMVVNKILSNGWKIEYVSAAMVSTAQSDLPNYYMFSRVDK